jgi:single-stranded DNA-binding protein
MNSVSFFGRLDSEPELRGMPGRDVCEFWLAVHGRRDKHTLYVKVVSFKGLACRLAEELSAGDRVAVSGHLRSERWPGHSPRRLYVHSVIARDVQRAGSASGGEGAS